MTSPPRPRAVYHGIRPDGLAPWRQHRPGRRRASGHRRAPRLLGRRRCVSRPWTSSRGASRLSFWHPVGQRP